MKNKNILICLEKLDIGGVETFILNQSVEFKKRGFEVYIISNPGVYNNVVEKYGINTIDFDFCGDNGLNSKKTEELIKIIKKYKIDQVYINQFPCYFSVVGACLFTKTPYVCYLHMSNSLLENANVFDWYENEYDVFKDLFKLTFDNAHKIVVIVDSIKEYILKRYDLNKNKIIVIKNSISFHLYKSARKSKTKDKFIYISRLDGQKQKSGENAIKLFDEYYKTNPEATLKIVGSGDKLKDLKKYASNMLSFEKIFFLGSRTDIVDLIDSSDIVLGMGRCVIEAMALEKMTVLIGYEDVVGILDKNNIQTASDSNYSGRGLNGLPIEEVINKIVKLDVKKIEEIIEYNYNYIFNRANISDSIYYVEDVLKTERNLYILYDTLARYYQTYLNYKTDNIILKEENYRLNDENNKLVAENENLILAHRSLVTKFKDKIKFILKNGLLK